MAPVRDQGATVGVEKPLRLRRYEAGRLPDPGTAVDALIVVNDRSDGVPRARLAISNGASWDTVAWLSEAQGMAQVVDVSPMVRTAVREMLPALVAPAPTVQIAAPAVHAEPLDLRTLAQGVLDVAEQFGDLARRVVELEERCEFLERSALARVRIEGAA